MSDLWTKPTTEDDRIPYSDMYTHSMELRVQNLTMPAQLAIHRYARESSKHHQNVYLIIDLNMQDAILLPF